QPTNDGGVRCDEPDEVESGSDPAAGPVALPRRLVTPSLVHAVREHGDDPSADVQHLQAHGSAAYHRKVDARGIRARIGRERDNRASPRACCSRPNGAEQTLLTATERDT